MFQSLPVRIKGIAAIVCSLISASVVIAYAAGYSITDFITPQDESKGSYRGSDSRPYYADELGYGKLIDLVSLRGTYGGAYYVNRSGYVTGYSNPASAAAPRTFIFGNGVVKNIGAPAGIYGDASGVKRAVLFNDEGRSDFNIPESSAPGWYPNVAKGSSNAGPGGPIIFPLPYPGSGSGLGPAPTPIPATLPLFGSGLVLLWILRRTSK